MDRTQLQAVGAEYPHLRGLLLGPLGIIVIASGLGNMEWGPFANPLVVPVLYLVAALACLPIIGFYRRSYGGVRISRSAEIKGGIALAICVPLVVAGTTIDHRMDLPVWGFLGSWAVLMLASYAFSVGLKLHHKIIWVAVLIACLLPVWGGLSPDLKSNLGLVAAGVGVIVTGIFDHLLLVKTFDAAAGLGVEA